MYNINIQQTQGDKIMFNKIFAILLVISMLFCVGCNKNSDTGSNNEGEAPAEPLTVNSLTGLKDIPEDKLMARPVAVMVNNINVAKDVQAGLPYADIVYETEVEGGITRLMAVYKDIESVKQIGSVRSARYVYVDLALGHDAIFVHCGSDPVYCRPRLASMQHLDIYDGSYGKKIENGKSGDHKLYTFSEQLLKGFNKKGFRQTENSTATWANFADEGETVALTGGNATEVTVPFSTSHKAEFKYNSEIGKYQRYIQGKLQKDYATGETVDVENIFVLLTTIKDYPDGEHREVALTSGDGYYFSEGKLNFIKWQKGAANNGFKFTDTDGKELKVTAGNSWVCIADKNKANPKYQ